MAGMTQRSARRAQMSGEGLSAQEQGGVSQFGGPPIGPPVFAAPDWLGDLAQTIEAEIIPRLMLAHGDLVDLPPAGVSATTISAREIHEFANLGVGEIVIGHALLAELSKESDADRISGPDHLLGRLDPGDEPLP